MVKTDFVPIRHRYEVHHVFNCLEWFLGPLRQVRAPVSLGKSPKEHLVARNVDLDSLVFELNQGCERTHFEVLVRVSSLHIVEQLRQTIRRKLPQLMESEER